MNKGPNPTSLARQHRYEINFSLTNPTDQGALHVANGQGRFVGTPYDSSDLEAACLTLAHAAPTDPLRDENADRLRRFIVRAEKLLDKKIARPGFLFPSLRMTEGAVNAGEIKEQIGEEWDAVALRLRPFINQELQGENIINIVTGAWRQHPEMAAIKQTIRRYYLLEAAARYRDLYLYRRGGVLIIASAFKDGAFEQSGARGSFLQTNFFGAEEDTADDRRQLEEYIKDPNGKVFHGGSVPYAYGVCRVMNDTFCDEWLQKIEYHDLAAERDFFTPYMDVEFAEWFVRYQLAYGLMDRILVLSWLSDLARKLVAS